MWPPMRQVVPPRKKFWPQKRWEREGEEGSRDHSGRGGRRKWKLPPPKAAGEKGWDYFIANPDTSVGQIFKNSNKILRNNVVSFNHHQCRFSVLQYNPLIKLAN